MMEQTLHKLTDMRLYTMADKMRELSDRAQLTTLSPSDAIGMMVDAEYDKRSQNRITRLLRQARLKIPDASVQDIIYSTKRNLHKDKLYDVVTGAFLSKCNNVLIQGATGVGKTFIASALGHLACMEGYTTQYFRISTFLEYATQQQATGNYLKFIEKIGKVRLLILEDLGPDIMTQKQRNHFLEVIEERYLKASTIITSQLSFEQWYAVFGDETVADAICDRIFHNAYKIPLGGDSMRKQKGAAKK